MTKGGLRTVNSDDAVGNTLRTPPHSYEAERALLGAILMNNKALERVSEFLLPDHFADPVNGRIFETILKMSAMNTQANVVTLKAYLEKDDLVAQAGGMKYLAALLAGAVTVLNTTEYGRLIEDLWRRRELMDIADQLATDACFPDPDTSASAIQEGHEARLNALNDGTSLTTGLTSLRDAMAATINRWNAAARDGLVGLSYGLPSVDAKAGLMQDGQMIVIGARPSMGKTSFAREIAIANARQFKAVADAAGTAPKHVVFFSAEMATDQQAGAYLTGFTGIMPPRVQGDITGEIATLMQAAADIGDLPLIIVDTPAITLTQMRAVLRRVERMPGGLGMFIGDYLQLFGIERGVKINGPVEKGTYLSNGWKELCRTVNRPGIVLSQLSRAVEQRENKRPMLSDLRDSGSIEQDGDVIMFVYREEYYLEREAPKQREKETQEQFSTRAMTYANDLEKARGKAEVIAAKVRIGAIGTAWLNWDGPRMLFSDPKAATGPYKTATQAAPSFELGDRT